VYKKVETIVEEQYCLGLKLEDRKDGKIMNVCICYLRPGPVDDGKVYQLREYLEKFATRQEGLLILGDFNARIGQLGDATEIEYSNYPNIEGVRSSRDSIVKKRGKEMVGVMQELGLLILNGRVSGDSQGEFTFVTHNGPSVLDLCIVNNIIAEIVNSLAIKSIGYSSHLAVELTIGESTTHTSSAEIECIGWYAAKQEKYELA